MATNSNDMGDLPFMVADELKLDKRVVGNVIRLLEEDNTVPFIARYRKSQTNGLEPQSIREIKEHLKLSTVRIKAKKLLAKLPDNVSHDITKSFMGARSFQELDELFAPFKKGGKGTLAERARKVGLETVSRAILEDPLRESGCQDVIDSQTEGRATLAEIYLGIQHILADIISKDIHAREKLQDLASHSSKLKCKCTKSVDELDKKKNFQDYYNSEYYIQNLKSHQILAINRGEQLKVLSVKVVLNKRTIESFLQWAENKWIPRHSTNENKSIISKAIGDAFTRLMEKRYTRQVRVELTKKAEREAILIFIRNLKSILLAPPLKGKVVLAIDPGFYHGCKCAVVGINGDVLETSVIYPQRNRKGAVDELCRLASQYRCSVIAIGNGTACRETEALVAQLIRSKAFGKLDVMYRIVDESGASTYSVTEEAEKELPNLDPNLRSAVSIARRLQDPLLELVKIDPKNLGVGMYQHDLPDTLLKGALEGTLEDSVSFVGIDLNACSESLLSRVAGMSQKKASLITQWRKRHGPFINRKQLLEIKGIGGKTFEQAAGFVRISTHNLNESEEIEEKLPTSVGSKRKLNIKGNVSSKRLKTTYKSEPLDQTWIHPESYDIAYGFLQKIKSDVSMIGTTTLCEKIDKQLAGDLNDLVAELQTDKETLKVIADGLKQPKLYDIRSELEEPLFRRDVTSLEDIKVGQRVTGKVKSVTSFAAFVDCGFCRDGFIHVSNMGTERNLEPGDRVVCVVVELNIPRNRFGLRLESKKSLALQLR